MKAFVAGATGGTGRRIAAELVKRGIPTRALVRDLAAAQKILPAQAELVVGDVLQYQTLVAAIADCDLILSATGAKPSLDPTGPLQVDYLGMQNLIKLAKQKQVKQLVMVSSLCTSLIFHPLNLFWLVLFWKKRAEEALQASGVTYTIVRPGGLKNDDTPGALIMSKADTLFEGSIPRTRVAQVCVDALFQPAAQNKIVEVVTKSELTDEKAIAELFMAV